MWPLKGGEKGMGRRSYSSIELNGGLRLQVESHLFRPFCTESKRGVWKTDRIHWLVLAAKGHSAKVYTQRD